MKERDRIARLQRRLDHLNERVTQSNRVNATISNGVGLHDTSYDVAEASALTWVIALAELALSNWPSGVQAVRDVENDS